MKADASLLRVTWFPSVRGAHGGGRFAFDRSTLEHWWRGPTPAGGLTDKGALPVWCAALFAGDRRAKAGVELVTALVLDFDAVPVSLRDVAQSTPMASIGHTSWSHGSPTKPGHCFRLLLPLSRPISPAEHARLWAWLEAVYGQRGATVDPSTKDPGRAWFVPCLRDGYEAVSLLERDVLDVEHALTEAPPIPPATTSADGARQGLHHAGPKACATVLERARRYLAKKDPAITGSGGHRALWHAAAALTRGFGLSETDAFALLAEDFNPRCQPPWAPSELARKVRETAKAEHMGLGYLLEERRGKP